MIMAVRCVDVYRSKSLHIPHNPPLFSSDKTQSDINYHLKYAKSHFNPHNDYALQKISMHPPGTCKGKYAFSSRWGFFFFFLLSRPGTFIFTHDRLTVQSVRLFSFFLFFFQIPQGFSVRVISSAKLRDLVC